jgi:hypothetical protein
MQTLKIPRLCCGLAFVLYPILANADDWTGFLSGAFLIVVAIPVGILNIILLLIFFVKKKYQSRNLAIAHSIACAIVPIIGIFFSIIDTHKIVEPVFFFIHTSGLLFSFLPLYFYRKFQHNNVA